MKTMLHRTAIVTVVFALPHVATAAFLEGNRFSVGHTYGPDLVSAAIESATATVGAGVEFPAFGVMDLFDIDVSDTSILITAIVASPAIGVNGLQFQDSFNEILPIESVSLNPNTNWTGFSSIRVLFFSDDRINVNLSILPSIPGERIQLDLTFVPEPGAAALLAPALALFIAHRRWRRR